MEENGIKFIAEEKEKTVAEEITHYEEESDLWGKLRTSNTLRWTQNCHQYFREVLIQRLLG